MLDKSRELLDEFRLVLGKTSALDAVLPPIVFLLFNGLFNFQAAMWASLVLSALIAVQRLWKKQSLWYSLAGVVSVGLAIVLSVVAGKSQGFFAVDIATDLMLAILALLSLVIHRPMVAWTSYIVRRWPLEWYWHPQVRPAYDEVTLAWTVFFASRFIFQFSLYRTADITVLAVSSIIIGWPGTILLLILSYLYGTWRLAKLHGPSVTEYREGAPPPWQSQRKGF